MNQPIDSLHQPTVVVRPVRTVITPKKSKDILSSTDSIYFGLKESNDDNLVVNLNLNDKSVVVNEADSIIIATSTSQPTTTLQHKSRGEGVLQPDSVWLLLIVTITLIICGIVKLRAPHFIPSLFSSLYTDQGVKSISITQSVSNLTPIILCKTLFMLSLSVLLYEIIKTQNITPIIEMNNLLLFSIILVTLLSFCTIKYIINKIIGFSFNISKMMSQITFYETISQSIIGITIIPITLLFPFANSSHYSVLAYISLFVIVGSYIWRLLKSSKIVLNFYVFLYLCAVEGAPLLCLYKATSILTN